ncbi:type II toxin-antitoxin system PemK/MazF family toxin [Paenibacillus anseongense]|uniref:type II toxin-antitoxin system PemK/MazF family toxin n=1 Tax=Paenibacillus anseongense TaxID=2682845 RepID=UPI002DBD9F0A|nr:type II toxin-antitoxin system PemK/MazF family toxin [Paenibacillus anseongense]MEC0265163.1 type II toxin-antitoxin system PemK/MazF family toxin [Paenibacillus anseongense]
MNQNHEYRRASIWLADLTGCYGSETGGLQRPVVIVQCEAGNRYSPTVQVCPITSSKTKKRLPTHVPLTAERHGLNRDSFVSVEQQRVLDKWRLTKCVAQLDEETMDQVDIALLISNGLYEKFIYRRDVITHVRSNR